MSYLIHANGQLDEKIKAIERMLAPRMTTFSSILVTGLSGAVPGAIIAWRYNKSLVVVRKGEANHGAPVEGKLTSDFIILDDFVASGATVARLIKTAREKLGNPHALPKWIAMYRADTWNCWARDYGPSTVEFQLDLLKGVPGLYQVGKERSLLGAEPPTKSGGTE